MLKLPKINNVALFVFVINLLMKFIWYKPGLTKEQGSKDKGH